MGNTCLGIALALVHKISYLTILYAHSTSQSLLVNFLLKVTVSWSRARLQKLVVCHGGVRCLGWSGRQGGVWHLHNR